ncbi:MAG: EexN family lipoprotein [Gammaproteobacteria bacterium]
MPIANKFIVACGCLGAAMLATTGCSPRRIPPMTVADLMEDRVLLDGVLMKCNQNQSKAHTDSDCLNARIAIERLAGQSEPAKEAKRAEDFERSRDQLRMNQEKQRREQEAKTKVDAYHLPLVPVDPAAPNPPAHSPERSDLNSNSPIVSQSSP